MKNVSLLEATNAPEMVREWDVGVIVIGPDLSLAFNRSVQRFPRVYPPASDSRVSCVAAY